MGDAGGGFGNVTLMLVVDTALTVEPLGAVNKIGHFLSIVIHFNLEIQLWGVAKCASKFRTNRRFACVYAKPTCLFIH